MKKIMLIISLMLFLFCNVAMASTPPAQETKQLISKYNEARFRLESGINYRDYQTLNQNLYTATKIYMENNPDGDFNKDFQYILDVYSDVKFTWEFKVEYGEKYLPVKKMQGDPSFTSDMKVRYINELIKKYPDVMAGCSGASTGLYGIDDIVTVLFGHVIDKTKNLNSSIKNTY